MTNLTVEMTEAQLFALDTIAIDRQEWADNVLTNRARVAIENLKNTSAWTQAITALAQDGGDTSDDEAILLKGRDLGLIKTAQEVADLQENTQVPVTPDTDPLTLPLNQVQFFTMMEFAFQLTEDQIIAAIKAAIADELQQLAVINKFKRETAYHRDNQLFALLAPAFNITDEQLDAAWLQGLSIK
jgi:hypothetical protein